MSRRRLMQNQGGELPSGYVRCQYLESNRKQYIDTNCTYGGSADRIKIKLSSLVSGVDLCFFGAYYDMYHDCEIGQIVSYSKGNLSTPFGPTITTKKIYEFENKNGQWEYDGQGFGATMYKPFSVTLLLFGRMYNNEPNILHECRIYSLNILRNELEILNFIPAIDPSGRPCMYDTITQQPLYNQGTGEFGYELLDGTYVAPI